jgi:heterodisulfide reductase subunit A
MSESEKQALRIGVFLCHCGTNIAGVLDMKELSEFAARLPGVVQTADNLYSCSEPGQQEIVRLITENSLNRVIVVACTPKLHEVTFRKCVIQAGLNPFLLEVTKKALVVGGGIAGLTAALDLAEAGVDTILVEREPSVGGRMAQLCKTFPTMDCPV